MNFPYFHGQEPCECGHYFTDVLRIKDVRRKGRWYRILDCMFCGKYRLRIKGNIAGKDEWLVDGVDIDDVRREERDRLLSRS